MTNMCELDYMDAIIRLGAAADGEFGDDVVPSPPVAPMMSKLASILDTVVLSST